MQQGSIDAGRIGTFGGRPPFCGGLRLLHAGGRRWVGGWLASIVEAEREKMREYGGSFLRTSCTSSRQERLLGIESPLSTCGLLETKTAQRVRVSTVIYGNLFPIYAADRPCALLMRDAACHRNVVGFIKFGGSHKSHDRTT
jgi:hypothetical protein